MIVRIERGRLETVPLGTIRRVAAALDARFDTVVRWQGGDLGRLVSARHAAMHEVVARMLADLHQWVAEPEVSFSIFGERGVIDILAWHPASRIVLVVELKTEFVDINELMGSIDRKRRLAWRIARDRNWDAVAVGTWVVLPGNRTNRRGLATHETALRAKFPADGRQVRRWLRRPGAFGRVQGRSKGSDTDPPRQPAADAATTRVSSATVGDVGSTDPSKDLGR